MYRTTEVGQLVEVVTSKQEVGLLLLSHVFLRDRLQFFGIPLGSDDGKVEKATRFFRPCQPLGPLRL